MTRNLYFGSTADAVTGATSFPALVAAAAQVYRRSRQANRRSARPPWRAKSPATTSISSDSRRPGSIRKGPLQLPPNPATFLPATTVVSDQLQLILDELDRLGERYKVVAIVPGL